MALVSTGRAIDLLPLPHFLKKALQDAGYKYTEDVLQISAADLAADLSIGIAQAEDLLRQCQPQEAGPSSSPQKRANGHGEALPSSTATQLLTEQQSLPRWSTMITTVDDLIHACANHPLSEDDRSVGGSLTPGMVMEISGPPGIGKTSMALALALSARIGSRRGKEPASSEVLVLDTEGGMTPSRMLRTAEIMLRTDSLDPAKVIHGVHFVRVATQIQMIAFLHSLDDWLTDHSEVELVIIDTLSFHFRQPTLDMNARRRCMDVVKAKIAKATTIHQCAVRIFLSESSGSAEPQVVVLNQLATKLFTADNKQGNFENGEKAVLMPHLGEMWTTAKTIKLALFRGPPGDDIRYAHASTSADGSFHSKWAPFDIDADGIPTDI